MGSGGGGGSISGVSGKALLLKTKLKRGDLVWIGLTDCSHCVFCISQGYSIMCFENRLNFQAAVCSGDHFLQYLSDPALLFYCSLI